MIPAWRKSQADHKAMLLALQQGTATPEQQRNAFAHLEAIKKQHNEDLREAERGSRDAYQQGKFDAEDQSARYF